MSDDIVLNINSFRRRLDSLERLVVELKNRINSESTIQDNTTSRLEMKIDDHYRQLDNLYDVVRTLNNQVFRDSENKQESKSPNERFIHVFPGKTCMFETINMCVLRDDKCVGFEHMDCPLNMYDRLVIEKHR